MNLFSLSLSLSQSQRLIHRRKVISQPQKRREKMKKLFKNWPEICKIGHVDRLFMLLLVSLDLSAIEKEPSSITEWRGQDEYEKSMKRNEKRKLANKIVEAFPNFFSGVLICGPVPFSMISEKLEELNKDGSYKNRANKICEEFDIPYVELGYMQNVNDAIREGWVAGIVPEEWFNDERFLNALEKINKDSRSIKEIFEWHNVKLVLIDHCPGDSIGLIPLVCIALDL